MKNLNKILISGLFLIILSLSVLAITESGTDFDDGVYNKTKRNATGIYLTDDDDEQELNVSDGTFNYTGLNAYWKFNNNTLEEIQNLTNNNVGTVVETNVGYVLNNAIIYNNGYTYFADNNNLDIINELSINFWINGYGRSNNRAILAKGDRASTISYQIQVNADDTFTFIAYDGATFYTADSTVSIPEGSWGQFAFVYSDILDTINVYNNGINIENISYTWSIVSNNDILTISKRKNGAGYDSDYDGAIDELSLWNRTLSSTEILNLYNRQKNEYINEGSYTSKDYGSIQSVYYEGDNYSQSATISYDLDNYVILFTGNGTETPIIYNITIENGSTATTYTSVKHFDVEIPDLTFDSSSSILLVQNYFNMTTAQTMYSRASFNTIKSNHPATTSLSMNEIINGVTLFDKVVRTMSLSSGWGIGNKPITSSILNIGTNNQSISVYESDQGGVTINNMELHNVINQSTLNNDIDMNSYSNDFSYSSVTYEPVHNFSFIKSTEAGTVIDITHTFSASDETETDCYVTGSPNSATYGNYISSSGTYRSSGIAFKDFNNASQSNYTLYCKNTLGATVYNNITVLLVSDQDVSGNVINSLSNNRQNLTLEAGTHRILNLTNFEIKGDGDEIETITTMVFKSLSGEQVPTIYLEIDGVESNHFQRQLQDNNDKATGKLYNSFSHSLGDIINGSFIVEVATGETLNLITVQGVLFEASTMDTTTGNLAPIIDIITPANGTNVSGTNQQILFSAVDINGNLDSCVLEILYDNETLLTTLSSSATSPFSINWTDFSPMVSYWINLSCNDTLGLTSSDKHSVYNNVGTLSNQLMTDIVVEKTNTAFEVAHSFDCNDYSCSNVNRTVTFDSAGCSVVVPDESSIIISSVTADTTYSENFTVVCTTSETININISLIYVSNNLSITDEFELEIAGGFGLEDESCMYTGAFTNGTLCAVGMAQAGINMIAILGTLTGFMVFFLVLYFFGDNLNDYMGGTKWLQFLKPAYFIIAMGISYVILWTLGELASSYGIADNIVNVLQFLMIPYAIICVIIAIFIMLGFTEQATKMRQDKNEGKF